MAPQLPKFRGEPLPGSTRSNIFYPEFFSATIEAKLGDTVQVKQPKGIAYGIILELWEERARPKSRHAKVERYQWAEMLWFDKADATHEV